MSVIIRPDYVTPLVYPEGSQPLHLEDSGLTEYYLSAVRLISYKDVVSGSDCWVKSYPHLARNNLLDGGYLGFRDGREFVKLCINDFRNFSRNKVILLLKGLVLDRKGRLGIPYLYEGDGKVEMSWDWLGPGCGGYGPAAHVASPQT